MILLQYENHENHENDFMTDLLSEISFVNKQKSIIYKDMIEWDVVCREQTILIRSPLCKLVYVTNRRVILQIQSNDVSDLFVRCISRLESAYQCSGSLIQCHHGVKSMIVEIDPYGMMFYKRNGEDVSFEVIKESYKESKPYVICMFYLDKRTQKNSEYNFRWRVFQMREYFIRRANQCLIRFKDDDKDVPDYEPYIKSFTHTPPTPPPPPPVFRVNTDVVIKKRVIIDKLKTENMNQYIMTKEQLEETIRRIKKK